MSGSASPGHTCNTTQPIVFTVSVACRCRNCHGTCAGVAVIPVWIGFLETTKIAPNFPFIFCTGTECLADLASWRPGQFVLLLPSTGNMNFPRGRRLIFFVKLNRGKPRPRPRSSPKKSTDFVFGRLPPKATNRHISMRSLQNPFLKAFAV